MKKILSIQDISCYGQCSLTVALPILSSKGIETAILPSAILSTHTMFNNFTVLDLTEEMPKIINHWINEKIKFEAIYTGYIGDTRQFDLIINNLDKLTTNNRLFVDPAMADNGKLYKALNQDIVEGMKKLITYSEIILPNLTEASLLLDIPYQEEYNEAYIKDLCYRLSLMGPKIVVITGVSFNKGMLGSLAYDAVNKEYIFFETEKCAKSYHGTGDIFSSIFIADLLNNMSIYEAIKDASLFIKQSIKNTMDDEKHSYGVKFETVLKDDYTE